MLSAREGAGTTADPAVPVASPQGGEVVEATGVVEATEVVEPGVVDVDGDAEPQPPATTPITTITSS